MALPWHVGPANAGQIRQDLRVIIDRRPAVLIVDMTATRSCDLPAISVLAWAGHRAAAHGMELRLVIAAAAVRRVIAFSQLDRLIPVFPSLRAAQDAGPAPALDHSSDVAMTSITSGIFRAGLTLQGAIDGSAETLREAARDVVDLLDDTIRQARTVAFAQPAGDRCGTGNAEGSPAPSAAREEVLNLSRLRKSQARQALARSLQVHAHAVEVAIQLAATQDRVAAAFSHAASCQPNRAAALRAVSQFAADHALRARQWASDHASTGHPPAIIPAGAPHLP